MLADFRNNLTTEEEIRLANNFLIDLPGEDLSQPQVLTDWQKRAWVAVAYSLSRFAYKILQTLKQKLPANNQDIIKNYTPVVIWLYYAAFDSLSRAELEDFFQHFNFILVLQDEDYIDLIRKIKLRLILEPLEERDSWRESIYNALHKNESAATENFITPGSRGSIANWLKEYDKETGVEIAENIKRAEFETLSGAQAHLDSQDKNNLKKLLDFYEFIKTTSFDLAGFEDTMVVKFNNKDYLIDGGRQIDLAARESEIRRFGLEVPEKAARIAPKTKLEDGAEALAVQPLPLFSAVVGEARKLLSTTQGQGNAVLLALGKALAENRTNEALGALLLLAQLRSLDDVLASDQNLQALVRDDLKFAKLEDKIEGLRLNPTAPNFIARFLKVALQDKLGLNAADALSFGQKLAQLLVLEGEKYSRIVIEDGKGGWKWNL